MKIMISKWQHRFSKEAFYLYHFSKKFLIAFLIYYHHSPSFLIISHQPTDYIFLLDIPPVKTRVWENTEHHAYICSSVCVSSYIWTCALVVWVLRSVEEEIMGASTPRKFFALLANRVLRPEVNRDTGAEGNSIRQPSSPSEWPKCIMSSIWT